LIAKKNNIPYIPYSFKSVHSGIDFLETQA